MAELKEESAPAQDPTDGGKYPARSPWYWVISLYFMQGLPVMMVMQMTTPMYTNMGIDNVRMTLWTSLITLPWTVKMLWGSMVDNFATKRAWVLATQGTIVAALAVAAFSMTLDAFFVLSLSALFLMAFASATHDIAADGFYMLGMRENRQAFFVGIRSASFRLATIFTTGALVVIAGQLAERGTLEKGPAWAAAIGIGAAVYAVCFAYGAFALPKPPLDDPREPVGPMRVVAILGRFGQIVLMVAGIVLTIRLIKLGYGLAFSGLSTAELAEKWGTPLFTETFRKLGTVSWPVSMDLAIAIGVIVVAAVSSRLLFRGIGMGPAFSEFFSQNRILSILAFIMFYRIGESMIAKLSGAFLLAPRESSQSLLMFESAVGAPLRPVLEHGLGGLGLKVSDVGFVSGTGGVIALLVGGLLGGWLISTYGLKKCFWPMVLSLNIPNFGYLYAAFQQPDFATPIGKLAVSAVLWIDQFGYGIGLAAYLVYLLFICQDSTRKTALYAIATGLMGLGALGAGILSGQIYNLLESRFPSMGYAYFYIACCILSIPGMIVLFFIPMDKRDLKTRVEVD